MIEQEHMNINQLQNIQSFIYYEKKNKTSKLAKS
jgi:hypothetical protein